MDATTPADAEILDPHDPDPFALHDGQALPEEAENAIFPIAEITDKGEPAGAQGFKRFICRGPAGHYHVIDLQGSNPPRVVGAPVTFNVAHDIAAAVLAGDSRTETRPGVTKLLALAFLAALAEAQRRKARAQTPGHELSASVAVANTAAPTPPSPPEPVGAAAASKHESREVAA